MKSFVNNHRLISVLVLVVVVGLALTMILRPSGSCSQPAEFKAWRSTLSREDSRKALKLYREAVEATNQANKDLDASKSIMYKINYGSMSSEEKDKALEEWDRLDKEAYDYITKAESNVTEIKGMGYTGSL